MPERPAGGTPGRPFTLLFVATLDYLPNTDAALWLLEEIVPALRDETDRPIRIVIAGPHPPNQLWELAQATEHVVLAGWVSDLGAWYAEADLVIVPVRAGGGTRIKALEAFAHRRPLVATAKAMEGIPAEPGRHYLQAAGTREFVGHCLAAMRDQEALQPMVERAFEFVRAGYARERVIHLIRRRCQDLTLTLL